MARINIESTWWVDGRRDELRRFLKADIQDQVMINVWKLAQEWWRRSKEPGTALLIPGHVFMHMIGHVEILASKLAIIYNIQLVQSSIFRTNLEHYSNMLEHTPNTPRTDPNRLEHNFVYVCGSRDQFNWMVENVSKKVEAGRKSAEVRRLLYGSAQPKLEHTPNTPEHRRTPPNLSISSSSSSSISVSKKYIGSIPTEEVNKQGNLLGPTHVGPKQVEQVEFDFEALYQLYPRRRGHHRKGEAIRYCRNNFKKLEDYQMLETAIRNYAKQMKLENKIGTELVAQFKTFVSGLWLEYGAEKVAQPSFEASKIRDQVAETKRQLQQEADLAASEFSSVAHPELDQNGSIDADVAKEAIQKIMNLGGFMKEMPKANRLHDSDE